MKRLVAVGAALSALALAGCSDGFRPVDVPAGAVGRASNARVFYVYDKTAQAFDYGMAVRACASVGQDIGTVQELPNESGLVTCRLPVKP